MAGYRMKRLNGSIAIRYGRVSQEARRPSSESSGRIGTRSQLKTRPRKRRAPKSAFATRLGGRAASSARMSATVCPSPPPGRSTTETSYKGTSCSTSCARSFRPRYSTGEARMTLSVSGPKACHVLRGEVLEQLGVHARGQDLERLYDPRPRPIEERVPVREIDARTPRRRQ